jgi:hypothetical protein
MSCEISIHSRTKQNIIILCCKIMSVFKNGQAVSSTPSETTGSKHGNEDAGVVQQDMVIQANAILFHCHRMFSGEFQAA